MKACQNDETVLGTFCPCSEHVKIRARKDLMKTHQPKTVKDFESKSSSWLRYSCCFLDLCGQSLLTFTELLFPWIFITVRHAQKRDYTLTSKYFGLLTLTEVAKVHTFFTLSVWRTYASLFKNLLIYSPRVFGFSALIKMFSIQQSTKPWRNRSKILKNLIHRSLNEQKFVKEWI